MRADFFLAHRVFGSGSCCCIEGKLVLAIILFDDTNAVYLNLFPFSSEISSLLALDFRFLLRLIGTYGTTSVSKKFSPSISSRSSINFAEYCLVSIYFALL